MDGINAADETLIYKVVISEEAHYSVWPAYKANAAGWNDAGKQGSKVECLNYINDIWSDVRPNHLGPTKDQIPRQVV